jgi:arylsulfatase A-like enzyme
MSGAHMILQDLVRFGVRISGSGIRCLVSAGAALGPVAALAQVSLPRQPAPFAGVVDEDRARSKPDWPKLITAPKGAPNVLLVLIDDVGFGATSITGGPVAAPALVRLAHEGLRYNNFHVNALCSPTRAALLSGRNDHEIGFGTVTEAATGYPGYNSIWPKSAASIAEVLRDNGYSTAAFGKWHNTPTWEVGPAGPFNHWPNALGFDYYYGFMAADDSQWEPRLYRNNVPAEPWGKPVDGYHLTTDLTNDAIHWLHQHDAVAPQKPFFLYFATGATHEPHQVPQKWIDKYKGKFDQGWDKLREETFARQKAQGIIPANAELTPRPAELPAWDSLTPDQKKLLAHQAEVYAGFLEQTDYEVGRLVDAIRVAGQADNTLVLYIVGDNGASGEGGLDGHDLVDVNGKPKPLDQRVKISPQLGSDLYFNHYAVGWAWGLDAPFQWTKQVASHLGGTTDPLVAVWPAKITDRGAVRGQFQHVTDIAPTIYEAAGVTPPDTVDGVKQLPLEGHSLLASFMNADAPSTHPLQYFEMVGNRGIYKDGWWAGSRHVLPWEIFGPKYLSTPIGNHPWELYNLTEDFSQAHDLAAENPDKLKELVALFDSEAKRNNVYPLVPNFSAPPYISQGQTHFVFAPDVARLTQQQLPNLRGRNYTLTADITVPDTGGDGVIVADGGVAGGFVIYVTNGTPVFEANANGNVAGLVAGSDKLQPGHNTIEADITANPSAKGPDAALRSLLARLPLPENVTLKVNGNTVGQGKIANYVGIYDETLDVGRDLGSPVSPTQSAPFTGKIASVTLDLK